MRAYLSPNSLWGLTFPQLPMGAYLSPNSLWGLTSPLTPYEGPPPPRVYTYICTGITITWSDFSSCNIQRDPYLVFLSAMEQLEGTQIRQNSNISRRKEWQEWIPTSVCRSNIAWGWSVCPGTSSPARETRIQVPDHYSLSYYMFIILFHLLVRFHGIQAWIHFEYKYLVVSVVKAPFTVIFDTFVLFHYAEEKVLRYVPHVKEDKLFGIIFILFIF